MVVPTVAKKATKGDIHHTTGQSEGRTLLVHSRLHSGYINGAAHLDLASAHIDTDQYMSRPTYLGHRENQARLRIIDRRASDPKRINIAAGECRKWNGTTHIGSPFYLPSACVQRVKRVSLRSNKHMLTNDQWLGIHRTIQRCTPCLRQPLQVGLIR